MPGIWRCSTVPLLRANSATRLVPACVLADPPGWAPFPRGFDGPVALATFWVATRAPIRMAILGRRGESRARGSMAMGSEDAERERLAQAARGRADWRRFGPYLADRQWGTVREDYSANGDAW